MSITKCRHQEDSLPASVFCSFCESNITDAEFTLLRFSDRVSKASWTQGVLYRRLTEILGEYPYSSAIATEMTAWGCEQSALFGLQCQIFDDLTSDLRELQRNLA